MPARSDGGSTKCARHTVLTSAEGYGSVVYEHLLQKRPALILNTADASVEPSGEILARWGCRPELHQKIDAAIVSHWAGGGGSCGVVDWQR